MLGFSGKGICMTKSSSVAGCTRHQLAGSCLGQITSGKWVGAQNWKCSNRER